MKETSSDWLRWKTAFPTDLNINIHLLRTEGGQTVVWSGGKSPHKVLLSSNARQLCRTVDSQEPLLYFWHCSTKTELQGYKLGLPLTVSHSLLFIPWPYINQRKGFSKGPNGKLSCTYSGTALIFLSALELHIGSKDAAAGLYCYNSFWTNYS